MKQAAKYIDQLRDKYGQPHLIHRALNQYFVQAYRTRKGQTEAKQLLDKVREVRSKHWWESVNSFTQTEKQQEGFNRARRGAHMSTEHEELLVKWVGTDWREVADGCTHEGEWTRMCKGLSVEICMKMGLAGCPEKVKEKKASTTQEKERKEGEERKEQEKRTEEQIKEELKKVGEEGWAEGGMRLRMVTDNQGVAEVLCGHSKLQEKNLRGMCVEVIEMMRKFRKAGWKAGKEGEDPWTWRYREMNAQADSICNLIMDQKQSKGEVTGDKALFHRICKRGKS